MKLIQPSEIDEIAFTEFIDEFLSAGEDLVPYSLIKNESSFNEYLERLDNESKGKGLQKGWVAASTFFLIDKKEKIIGAVNIRHELTEDLKTEGGHIGYGVRPSSRNQGYGVFALKLALEKAKNLGIKEVLITCDKENTYSAKVILKNNGQFSSEVEKESKKLLRYWIKL